MIRLWISTLAVAVAVAAALAPGAVAAPADDGLATLTADRIVYTSGYRTLRASGHVVILYKGVRLEAAAVVYDQANDHISARGPLRLVKGDEVAILADLAELSGDMREGVMKSARMVLNGQLQLTARELRRSEGRYNQLVQAAASSCKVTKAHPTPLWQIRARRIVHDEEKKQLFFEGAQLRLGALPIAYVPNLRVPGPSVKRASGFLVPGVSNRSGLGTGVYVPYFLTLGRYADLTLTPRVYTSGTAALGFELRKRFATGALDLKGAVAHDTMAANTLRAYLFGTGAWRLGNAVKADLQLQLASDNDYLSDHGISNLTRLENRLALTRTTRHSFYGGELRGYRSLTTAIAADEIPFLLGSVSARHRWTPAILGGQLGLSLAADSYTRRSGADIVGRDTLRLSSAADWQREWIAPSGLVFATRAEIHGDYYRTSGDSTYPGPIARTVPIAAADFRLPLMRQGARATHVIEPRLQLVWSPESSTAVPDEDSRLVEFEAANLFALNHFSGIDRIERGLRANIGLGYSRRAASGWNVDALIGQVLRVTDFGQFTGVSGLSGTASSYVLGAQVTLPERFRLVERAVFDGSLALSKAETRLAYRSGRFDLASSYLWLAAGVADNTADRSEWIADTSVPIARNWHSEVSWRYDLIAAAPSEARLAFVYHNECIQVDLSLSRRFTAVSNLGPSTNLGLMVSLEGFGSRATSDAYQRKCNDL